MSRATRSTRFLVLPLSGLAVALATVPAVSVSAAPTEPTTVSIKFTRGSKTLVGKDLYGVYFDGIGPDTRYDTFRVRGRLTSAGVPLAGKEVRLYRLRKTDKGDLQPIAKGQTDAHGGYSFWQRVKSGAYYAVQFEGDETYALSNSGRPRFVPAVRDFNAVKRKINGKLYFRGTVRPYWNNRVVVLQKQRCGTCSWRTVATKRTGPAGGWSFRVRYPKKVGPVWRWQAVLREAGDFEKSYSVFLTTERVRARTAAARLG